MPDESLKFERTGLVSPLSILLLVEFMGSCSREDFVTSAFGTVCLQS